MHQMGVYGRASLGITNNASMDRFLTSSRIRLGVMPRPGRRSPFIRLDLKPISADYNFYYKAPPVQKKIHIDLYKTLKKK